MIIPLEFLPIWVDGYIIYNQILDATWILSLNPIKSLSCKKVKTIMRFFLEYNLVICCTIFILFQRNKLPHRFAGPSWRIPTKYEKFLLSLLIFLIIIFCDYNTHLQWILYDKVFMTRIFLCSHRKLWKRRTNGKLILSQHN